MMKIACEITNLLKDGKATIAEATLSLDGQECIVATGKAICNPKDNFDENAGVKIATARAKMKAYNKLYKMLSNYEDELYNFLDSIDGIMDKVDDRLAECQDTINDNAYPDEEADDDDGDDGDETSPTDPLDVPADNPAPATVSTPIATDSDEKDE
jgi:hypothetical protein